LQREKLEELGTEEDFRMPMNQRVEDNLNTEGLQMASKHTAIPDNNKGFQMLKRMGWKGQGLGANEDGEGTTKSDSNYQFPPISGLHLDYY